MYLGERKTADGAVHKDPGKTNIGFFATDVKLRSGEHEYTVELPRLARKWENSQKLAEHMPEVIPFRFAELVPSAAGIAVSRVRQVALFYPFDDTAATFTSSDERLDRVWQLCKHTLHAISAQNDQAYGPVARFTYMPSSYGFALYHAKKASIA